MTQPPIDRRHAEDARAVELMTRWTLVMLQNAQQSLVPIKALERFVDPAVLHALGPITPRQPDAADQKPRVGRVRIHLVHDGLAHVAAVAPGPEGSPAGYVLELRRGSARERWRITEMTRVEQRRLVPTSARTSAEHVGDPQLPADLAARMRAAEQARQTALRNLDRANSRAADLLDRAAQIKSPTVRKKHERARLRGEAQSAQAQAERWQNAVRKIEQEQHELREIADMREVRQLVVEGDPLVKARAPVYLDRLLGPLPQELEHRTGWRQTASQIERYRDTWSITDRQNALGGLPTGAPPEQRHDHQAVTATVQAYLQSREKQRERTGETDFELDL
jgi:hypothetical protein